MNKAYKHGKNPYIQNKSKRALGTVAEQKAQMEADLSQHKRLSDSIMELTGFKQVKAFRMALKMTSAQELAAQANHSALQECLSQTQLGARLKEDRSL